MKEIKYIEVDGLLYHDLEIPTQKEVHLSKYGRMKLKYLKEHRRIIYTNLLVSGELFGYLEKIDNEMNEFYNRLIEQYKVKRSYHCS